MAQKTFLPVSSLKSFTKQAIDKAATLSYFYTLIHLISSKENPRRTSLRPADRVLSAAILRNPNIVRKIQGAAKVYYNAS
jgi:hypothetical protein